MNNPNDPLRLEILKYLYELHLNHNGTHRNETQGDRLSYAVRDYTGATREAIGANLNDLVETGFVHHRREPHFLPDGRQIEGKHLYKIAGPGIDRIEGNSEFMAQGKNSIVTITNRDGVAIVGSGNTVVIDQHDLPAILAQLARVIEANREISDVVRRDLLCDLETIRAQTQKKAPNQNIIAAAWEGFKILDTSSGATGLLKQAAALLGL